MSSLRFAGESSTNNLAESADTANSTSNSAPVKKTVIYKETVIFNFTKVFAAKAEATRLRQLSTVEKPPSPVQTTETTEVVAVLLNKVSEVHIQDTSSVEKAPENEVVAVAVADQSSTVSLEAALTAVLTEIMPTIPSVPAPPMPQVVHEPPPALAPVAVQEPIVVPRAPVVLNDDKTFSFSDYWDERWGGEGGGAKKDEPPEVFTMSSNVVVQPVEKSAPASVVNEKPVDAPENRTYTAPFRSTDRLKDLAAAPVLPPAVKPRRKPEPLKTKENQRINGENTIANDKPAKPKETSASKPLFTPRTVTPAKRKAEETPGKPKTSPRSLVETLRQSLPVTKDVGDLTSIKAPEPISPPKGTNWARVDVQMRAAEGLGSGLVQPRDGLLMPSFALENASSVSSDVVSSSAVDAGPLSPDYSSLSPAQVGLSPARDPRPQPKTSEEKLRNVSLSPTSTEISGSSSVGKSRGRWAPGSHLVDSYWASVVSYFDALLRMDVQETFRLATAPLSLRPAPARSDIELPLAPNSGEYIKLMQSYIKADLEDKLKEAIRQCRLKLDKIPMNVRYMDCSQSHDADRTDRSERPPGRVNLAGLDDELKNIHPFDALLLVFTPQKSRSDSGSKALDSQRHYAFGVVQSSKAVDALDHKLLVYVANQHFSKLVNARIKDNPRRPTYNAAVVPLLSLKYLDNWVFGLHSLSSRPYPLTNAWTELDQAPFQYSLPPNPSPFPFDHKVNASQKEAILAVADCFHPDKNKAAVRVVLGAAHTGKIRVLAGALSISLQKRASGQFLVLVPSVGDLERVTQNLVTEWRSIHDTEVVREALIHNSVMLLPETAVPPWSYLHSTLDILHKHPVFLEECKVLDDQIKKVKEQIAEGNSKTSPDVLSAELKRFEKIRSDTLAAAVTRIFSSKEKASLARELQQHVKTGVLPKNVFVAPLSFLLDDNQLPYIHYGLLPPLDGIFVYDAGKYTELELLLALTRFPPSDATAPKVALIGDHMSIPLNSDGQEVPVSPLSSSFLHRYFKRYGLLTDNVSLALKGQYHVDQEIFRYANTAFYSNILSTISSKIISNLSSYHFFDLHGLDNTDKEGKEGLDDAEYTIKFIKTLMSVAGGEDKLSSFVILTRTANYCHKLRDLIEYELPNVEAHTMAAFQGRVADTVLFCADAADLKEGECSWEQKRICQAMSAAREHLYILGHVKSLKVIGRPANETYKVNKTWLDVSTDAAKRKKKDAILAAGVGGELVSPERILERLKLR